MSGFDPAAHGWRVLPGAALPGGLGMPWALKVGEQWRYGLLTEPGHVNPSGAVHGGVLMAFADHGLSFLAWEAAARAPCATIQMNSQFLDGVVPGEFVELRGEVVRRTNSLVFVRGLLVALGDAADREVVAVDGIWRILRRQ
jgi:acyl-coenzyme A thioesterase PaaI-like protein